jgi:UDP-N-acetylglucosamine 1-carboxyvinyltransferase
MQELKIEGGDKVFGEIKISGNKNAALPIIAASLLTDEEVVIKNIPNIIDVRVMLELAEILGAEIDFENNTLRIRTKDIKNNQISHELSAKVRTSILFCAPLIARTNKATIWPPGGDVIGRRRLDAHFYGLNA